jgi:transcriptional/translational regulatory protein YebC/TACO1
MVATTTVAVDAADAAKKVLRLVDALDEHDDVQDVYANFDIPDDVLESVEA